MNSIFISYRREDTEGQAGRLYDDLAAKLGSDSVFIDVAALHPGLDFRVALHEGLSSCGVCLAVIGKNWLNAVDSSNQRRLDDPADFVRYETAEVLKRGNIPLIPVLVQGTSMPRADQLPDDIKELAFRHAFELSYSHWQTDVEALIKELETHVGKAAPPAPTPLPVPQKSTASYGKWLVLGGLAIILAVSGWYFTHQASPSIAAPTPSSPVARVRDFSGVWVQTNAQTNVAKPEPPMRLRLTQQARVITVELGDVNSPSFSSRPIGKAVLKNQTAEWTAPGGCGGMSKFILYFRGNTLMYEVKDTFPAPCGGHAAGEEHRPIAEFQRESPAKK